MMYRSKSIMGENEVRVFKETNKIDKTIIQIIIDNFCVKLVEIQSLAVFGNPNIPSLTTEQSKTNVSRLGKKITASTRDQ